MLVYSDILGMEFPLTSVYAMRWWASMSISYEISCVMNDAENRMNFQLNSTKKVVLEKQLITIKDEKFGIERNEIAVDTNEELLLTSEFFTGLESKAQEELNEIISLISRLTLKSQASATTMQQMHGAMSQEQLAKYEPYSSEAKKHKKLTRRLNRAYNRLEEYSANLTTDLHDRETIPLAREWPEWNDYVEYMYVSIADPEENDNSGFMPSPAFEDDEDKEENNEDILSVLENQVPASDHLVAKFIAGTAQNLIGLAGPNAPRVTEDNSDAIPE